MPSKYFFQSKNKKRKYFFLKIFFNSITTNRLAQYHRIHRWYRERRHLALASLATAPGHGCATRTLWSEQVDQDRSDSPTSLASAHTLSAHPITLDDFVDRQLRLPHPPEVGTASPVSG